LQEQRKLKIKIDWRRKMKNLRNLFATVALMAVLMFSASAAKAGILMTDNLSKDNPQTCTETKNHTKTDWGIVITSFTGIVITSFTGIVITSAVDTPVNCGIVITS
jgi:choline-glycine betaine transporter